VERAMIQSDIRLAARDDRFIAQRSPQRVERIAKRVAGRFFRGLRPKERDESITRLQARRLGERKIKQQCEPLWLCQGFTLPAFQPIRADIKSAQNPQIDHWRVPVTE
jgi:hypothetical protein